MSKSIPKKRPKISLKRQCQRKPTLFPKATTVLCGVDISMSSIAIAAISYDAVLKEIRGPEFSIWRWATNTHYFDRISDCSRPENFFFDLYSELNAIVELENVFVAVEEPWPFGMVGRSQSSHLKQQAEISGAFLGGLLRYGVKNIYQIPANYWRQVVAADLGITIHYSKWKDPNLADKYNCKPTDVGKFRAKQWALEFSNWKVPDWPDIINSKGGKIPRPEESRAKSMQPDDRYDSLAIMTWMEQEWKRSLEKD